MHSKGISFNGYLKFHAFLSCHNGQKYKNVRFCAFDRIFKPQKNKNFCFCSFDGGLFFDVFQYVVEDAEPADVPYRSKDEHDQHKD